MYDTNGTNALKQESNFQLYKRIAMYLLALSVVLLVIGVSPIIAVFILIGVISMYPMKYVDWLGVEMCTFFTVFTSMVYGVAPGIMVGKVANTVGIALAGKLDENIVYDFIIFFVIAVGAAYFPPEMIVPVGIGLNLLYHVGYVGYNSAMGMLESDDVLFAITNFIFNVAIFWRLGPIMVNMFV